MTDRSPDSPDLYDRMIGSLDGLPDVAKTRPSTLRTIVPVVGHSQTHIVQTYRQAEVGDTIFLEVVSREGSVRIVIPPPVAEAIARQRDALTAKVRSKVARRLAQERKDRGELPGFMRKKAAPKKG